MTETTKTLRSEFEALERRPVQDDEDAWGLGRELLALGRRALAQVDAADRAMLMIRALIVEGFQDADTNFRDWQTRVRRAIDNTEATALAYEARVQAVAWEDAAALVAAKAHGSAETGCVADHATCAVLHEATAALRAKAALLKEGTHG